MGDGLEKRDARGECKRISGTKGVSSKGGDRGDRRTAGSGVWGLACGKLCVLRRPCV